MFKYILIAASILFIGLLFPDHVQFQYQFERGQTWQYLELEAPFDFAIQKPREEIDAEIEELRANFSPYYQLRSDMATEEVDSFRRTFNQLIDSIPVAEQFPDVRDNTGRYLGLGSTFLTDLYQRGIIERANAHQDKDGNFTIHLIEGATTQERRIGRFLTVPEAMQAVSDTLSSSQLAEAEFLYPLLEEHVRPNIIFNDTLTERSWEDQMAQVSPTRGMVKKGDLIVTRGGRVTDEVYQKLVSLKGQYEQAIMANESRLTVMVGYFLITALIIGIFVIYLATFHKEVFNSLPNMIFIFLWLVGYSYLTYVVENIQELSAYLIPFCIVPIVVKSFFNSRLALFTHIVVVLLASFLSSEGFQFTFLQLLAGITVLLSDVETREWTKFFYSIFFIFLAYGLGYLGMSLIQQADIPSIPWNFYRWTGDGFIPISGIFTPYWELVL